MNIFFLMITNSDVFVRESLSLKLKIVVALHVSGLEAFCLLFQFFSISGILCYVHEWFYECGKPICNPESLESMAPIEKKQNKKN